MSIFPVPPAKSSTWPITIGAEGIAAAQFARCGFDVLVQAGRDKPWYDLLVTKAGNLLKVSIKASEDGKWALAEGFGRRTSDGPRCAAESRRAIDLWLDGQGSRTIVCLVQFEGVGLDQLPRIYLATPQEIASAMRLAVERTGQCALREQYEWIAEDGLMQAEALPPGWSFSRERIEDLLHPAAPPVPLSWPGMNQTVAKAPIAVQKSAAGLAISA